MRSQCGCRQSSCLTSSTVMPCWAVDDDSPEYTEVHGIPGLRARYEHGRGILYRPGFPGRIAIPATPGLWRKAVNVAAGLYGPGDQVRIPWQLSPHDWHPGEIRSPRHGPGRFLWQAPATSAVGLSPASCAAFPACASCLAPTGTTCGSITTQTARTSSLNGRTAPLTQPCWSGCLIRFSGRVRNWSCNPGSLWRTAIPARKARSQSVPPGDPAARSCSATACHQATAASVRSGHNVSLGAKRAVPPGQRARTTPM